MSILMHPKYTSIRKALTDILSNQESEVIVLHHTTSNLVYYITIKRIDDDELEVTIFPQGYPKYIRTKYLRAGAIKSYHQRIIDFVKQIEKKYGAEINGFH